MTLLKIHGQCLELKVAGAFAGWKRIHSGTGIHRGEMVTIAAISLPGLSCFYNNNMLGCLHDQSYIRSIQHPTHLQIMCKREPS